jgi:hypothetical protein
MANRYHAGFAAVLFFCGTALAAQEFADGGAAPFFFPVHRLWQDARGGAVRWQPDWPLEMPPDSFEPVATGRARRVTVAVTAVLDGPPQTENAENAAGAGLESSGLSPGSGPDAERAENAALPAEYTARLDSDGRFTAFPFLLNGVFHQASARYGRGGMIEAMTLAVSPEESVEIVFLETVEGGDGRIGGAAAAYRTVVARIKTAGAYYFVSFRWEAGGCVELWTDEAGTPLGILRDERVLHYDSMGNRTFMDDGASSVSARYNMAGVRYWSTAQSELFFQRDGSGLIVRLTDVQESAPDAAVPPVNFSYDYRFDENGAWTERREVRWVETQGYLVPAPGTLVTRVIDYVPVPDR